MARIGMPVAADFEDSEFTVPKDAFQNAGHEVIVIGTHRGEALEGKRGQAVARTTAAADVAASCACANDPNAPPRHASAPPASASCAVSAANVRTPLSPTATRSTPW